MAGTSLLSAMCKRLEGKVALITGGASGIGKSTAKLFSNHGAKVVIADIQDSLGSTLTETLGPSNSAYVHCDVTNEDHVKNAVDIAVSTYGKLDIMFNNAGIIDRKIPRIIDNQVEDFDRVMKVNVRGVFLGMKHSARVMIPAGTGCIISTASQVSGCGGVAPHAYTCSKYAVVGLTRNLAMEVGQFGIRVNCLSPSGVETPLATGYMGKEGPEFEEAMNAQCNLKGATLHADDVAKSALYLACDDGKFVTGQNLFVDGGFSVRNAVNIFLGPNV